MSNPNDIEIVRRYTNKQYGIDVVLYDCEDRNQQFDLYVADRNLHLSIEYKNRKFVEKTKNYMNEDDILIEVIQTLPYFIHNNIPTNKNINNMYSAYKINMAIGWFYKVSANRLYYIKYFEEKFHELVDIEFQTFKSWLLNNMIKQQLQYCDKTTGTINVKVPYIEIPTPLITVIDKNGEERKNFRELHLQSDFFNQSGVYV